MITTRTEVTVTCDGRKGCGTLPLVTVTEAALREILAAHGWWLGTGDDKRTICTYCKELMQANGELPPRAPASP